LEQVLALERVLAIMQDTPDAAAWHTIIKCRLRPLSHLTLFDSLLEQVLALERVLTVVRDTPDAAARHTIIKCNTP
jgi:hypothetical protein